MNEILPGIGSPRCLTLPKEVVVFFLSFYGKSSSLTRDFLVIQDSLLPLGQQDNVNIYTALSRSLRLSNIPLLFLLERGLQTLPLGNNTSHSNLGKTTPTPAQ